MRLEHIGRDLKHAIERLRRAPLFVAVVVLTFALGIGANVAVFSAFSGIVLRPLPYADAGRLVAISKRVGNRTGGQLTALDISDLKEQLHDVAALAGVTETYSTMTIGGVSVQTTGAQVSTSFFRTLWVAPKLGRFFAESNETADLNSAVISYKYWLKYFNGDIGAIGKRITLDGTAYTIVGVAPAELRVPEPWGESGGTFAQPDYFIVMPAESPTYTRGLGGTIGAIAALTPGATVTQLNSELLVASARVQARYPNDAHDQDQRITFLARPLAAQFIGPVVLSLGTLLAAVFGVLLIACANVANLIATRWSSREQEVAVRRALGASNERIAAQLLAETGLLALCGGVIGVGLAIAAVHFIPLGSIGDLPRADAIGVDWRVLLYALLMVCLTTVLSGLAPILSLRRVGLQTVLKGAGRGGDASRGHRLRAVLIVAEVALAVALVISSALIAHTFVRLVNAPAGFRPQGVFATFPFRSNPEPLSRGPNHDPQFLLRTQAKERELLSRVAALPGIDSAALSRVPPLYDADTFVSSPAIHNQTASCAGHLLVTDSIVSSDYFRTLGVPLLRGRFFTQSDSATTAPVVIVNQAFVDKFWPQGQAVGQSIGYCPGSGPWSTVVGVVPNISQRVGQQPTPEIYRSITQQAHPFAVLIVHAPQLSPGDVQREIGSAFAEVYPGTEAPSILTIPDIIARETQTQRFAASLLTALALVSLLLALSGIYGVVSFSTAQRSREFGIRMALGAGTGKIVWDVLRRSFTITAVGTAIGVALAALDAHAVAPYLTLRPDAVRAMGGMKSTVVVSPFDPPTFGMVIVLIFACAALAALIPAWRATRVDPVVALKYE